MTRAAEFVATLAAQEKPTETDDAIAVAWFLSLESANDPINVSTVAKFFKDWSLRPNVNQTRLRQNLNRRKDISCKSDGMIAIPAKQQTKLNEQFSRFLTPKEFEVSDTLLELGDFEGSKGYVKKLARQVNGAMQVGLYDCCAVMMRRLMEVLIIDAYENKGFASEIRSPDGYYPLSNLVNQIESGRHFKLSKNAPRNMKAIKALGDNAAHSRTYITKEIDITDQAMAFRSLISELQGFAA